MPEADFIPPYPLRLSANPSMFSLIKMARLNFLSVFSAQDFSTRLIFLKILRRQIVVANGPVLIRDCFQVNHKILQRKSPQVRHSLKPLIGDGVFISDGETWTSRRKLITPILHAARVKSYTPLIVSAITDMKDDWAKLPDGHELDVQTEMGNLTAEVICRSVFGHNLGRTYSSAIVDGFTAYQKHVDQIDFPSLLGLPDWFPRFRRRKTRRAAQNILSVLDEIITLFISHQDGQETSVLQGLLSAQDENGAFLSKTAVRNEAAVMFLAGQEGTGNTLSWAWYLMSQSPRVRKSVQEEVDRVFAGPAAQHSDLASFPYTRAVIEEALRLYPPVPILAREALSDLKIGNRRVRKGSLVLVIPWILHRSPNFWKDAESFRPERHLDGHPDEERNKSKYTYLPFGIGPRICAGQVFGLTEAVLALAHLAHHFDLSLKEGAKVTPMCRLTLRFETGLPMLLRKRIHSDRSRASRQPAVNNA